MRSLLIGCGNSRTRRVYVGPTTEGWPGELVTLDIDPGTGCDVVHDLEHLPYPFADQQFDEIHAYEVLEHTGRQGDWRFFFAQFSELYRILKPGGFIYITVPSEGSVWAWGDPGHTRVLPKVVFQWLDQSHYDQVGKTSCTDYRFCWKGDLKVVAANDTGEGLLVILRRPE